MTHISSLQSFAPLPTLNPSSFTPHVLEKRSPSSYLVPNPPKLQKKSGTFGGVHEKGKLENHYQFLEIHGRKWLVLSLEMGPRKAVIKWANQVLAEHKDHPAIILTHGYLYYDNQRYNHRLGRQRATPHNFYGEGADGEQLWNAMVRTHPNVMLVVCGHLSSGYVGYRVDDCAAALAQMVAAGATPIDRAPRPGSRGTTVAFVHPKGSFGTLIELVQE